MKHIVLDGLLGNTVGNERVLEIIKWEEKSVDSYKQIYTLALTMDGGEW